MYPFPVLGWCDRLMTFLILHRPRVLNLEDVNRPEQLVPLRIEFDVEHHKMRDTFVWNLNGKLSFFLPPPFKH